MPGLVNWLVVGILLGVSAGLSLGLIDGIRFERKARNKHLDKSPTFWQLVASVLVLWLVGGLATGPILWLFVEPVLVLSFVLLAGLVNALLFGLRGSRQSLTHDIQTIEALSWSWQKALKVVLLGLIGGFIFGLINAWINELDQELVNHLRSGPISGLLDKWGFVLSIGLFWGLLWGLMAAMFGGLNSKIVETKTTPNQGLGLSLRNALLTGPGFGLIIGLFGGLLHGVLFGFQNGIGFGLWFGVSMGVIAFMWYGGLDIIQHYTLRVILWYRGHIPFVYFRFLNYATERIFLQRVGGGYIFIHRLLLEHFATMDVQGRQVE
jgi:hypothetical protein